MFERFGGKRAIASRFQTSVAIALGWDRQFVAPLVRPVNRVVFVCAGNICRSPFAEYFARTLDMHTTSGGLRADRGVMAAPIAISHAKLFGVDLMQHRARAIIDLDLQESDLVLGFERWHVHALNELIGDKPVQVRLLGTWLGMMHYHVHDPYGLADSYFSQCFGNIAQGLHNLKSTLEKINKSCAF